MLTVFFGFMTEKLRKVRQPRAMVSLVLINTAGNRVARCDRRLPNDRRNEHFILLEAVVKGYHQCPFTIRTGESFVLDE